MSVFRNWWHRSGAVDTPRSTGCPQCGTALLACPSCRGRFDRGRLCQACMFGNICPACQRHWIRP